MAKAKKSKKGKKAKKAKKAVTAKKKSAKKIGEEGRQEVGEERPRRNPPRNRPRRPPKKTAKKSAKKAAPKKAAKKPRRPKKAARTQPADTRRPPLPTPAPEPAPDAELAARRRRARATPPAVTERGRRVQATTPSSAATSLADARSFGTRPQRLRCGLLLGGSPTANQGWSRACRFAAGRQLPPASFCCRRFQMWLSRHGRRRDCCRNATPANNLSRNRQNAQKGGRCLTFLLHRAWCARSRLRHVSEFGCSRLSLAPGGRRSRTVLRK